MKKLFFISDENRNIFEKLIEFLGPISIIGFLRYLIPKQQQNSAFQYMLILLFHTAFFLAIMACNNLYNSIKSKLYKNLTFYRLPLIFLDVFFNIILWGFILAAFIGVISTMFPIDLLQGKTTIMQLYNNSFIYNLVESFIRFDFSIYEPFAKVFFKVYLAALIIVLFIKKLKGLLNQGGNHEKTN